MSRSLISRRFVSVLLLALFGGRSLVSATCYWQNSTLAPDSPYSIAPDDTACFPDQDNSPCCGTGWTCLSDGVCYIEQGSNSFYYRGTCTDRTWDSQQCPGWCFAENANTSIPLLKCTESNGEDWYCCPGDDNCSCDTGKDALKLGASQPVTVTVIGSTSWPGFSSTSSGYSISALVNDGTSTDTTLTTTSVMSTSSVSTSTPTSGASPSTSGATSNGTAAASPASSTGVAAVSSTSSHSNTGLAAGLGAGLGVAAVAIAVLVFYVLRNRQKKTRDGVHAEPSAPSYSEMPDAQNGHGPGGAFAEMEHKTFHPSSELPATAPYQRCEVAGDAPAVPDQNGYGYGETRTNSRPGRAEMA